MDNELSQLDALIESDVLDALGKNSETKLEGEDVEDIIDSTDTNDSDEIIIEDFLEDENNDDITGEEDKEENDDNQNEEDISLNENMLTEEPLLNTPLETPITVEENLTGTNLAKLLSELLNNKTIEITIKIKE